MPSYKSDLFKDNQKKPPLFKIEKNGKSRYLFGTLHYLALEVLPLSYQAIIRGCNTVVLESQSKKKESTEEDLIKEGLITRDAGSKWYSKLSPKALSILQCGIKLFFTGWKGTPIPLDRIVPSRACILIHAGVSLGGMDDQLHTQAETIYTLEEQASVLPYMRLSLEETEEMLLSEFGCVLDPPEYNLDTIQFLNSYLDDSLFYNRAFTTAQETAKFVTERNQAWLPRLLHYHETLPNDSIVAVGFAHLVGNTGLLCALEREGFTISKFIPELNIFAPMLPSCVFGEAPDNIPLEKAKAVIQLLQTTRHFDTVIADTVIDYLGRKPVIFSNVNNATSIVTANTRIETPNTNHQNTRVSSY